MKIRSVRSDARRRSFRVSTARGTFEFPWCEARPAPSPGDPVRAVAPDPDLGGEGFTYRLASGGEGTVHLDHVLRFARDPDYERRELLYALTNEARDALEASGRSKRGLARQLGTSLAQIARLLDPANGRKSLDQMVRIVVALGRTVELRSRPGGAARVAERAPGYGGGGPSPPRTPPGGNRGRGRHGSPPSGR